MAASKLIINTTHYDRLFQQAPVGVVIVDPQGILLWHNNLAKALLGGTVKPGDVMLHSKDWPGFRELILQKSPFFYLVNEQGFVFTPQVLEENEDCILLWMVPSTTMEIDLVKMQQDLIQQRKLANLGKMMLELAHELNNPLTGISMGLQLIGMTMKKLKKQLQEALPENTQMAAMIDKMQQELDKANKSTAKAAGLRQDLMAYSKPNNLNLRPYQTSKLIELSFAGFQSQPIFKKMKIEFQLDPNSPTILCDPSKMEQIFYNLVKNAHEATEGAGRVIVRELVKDAMVLIEVEDNGPGIPEKLLDKIFSPFLTTKPRTGTGLGLSISQQIIQQHGGTFSVYNKPGSGACFQISFPIIKKNESVSRL